MFVQFDVGRKPESTTTNARPTHRPPRGDTNSPLLGVNSVAVESGAVVGFAGNPYALVVDAGFKYESTTRRVSVQRIGSFDDALTEPLAP